MIPIARMQLDSTLEKELSSLRLRITCALEGQRTTAARNLWKSSSVRRNVHKPLFDILEKMAPGLCRCMYCGESIGVSIDHFEPVARNAVRTFDWRNHLLACTTCNSNHKRDRYPVDSHDAPLLIDPTAEDPLEHLLLSISTGEYLALTAKGEASIEVFGLNVGLRPRGRQQAARVVELALLRWAQAETGGDESEKAICIRTIRDQPFADVAYSMLRQSNGPNASVLFRPEILSVLREDEVRDALT
jgi:hypothetical protein